jgi:hypothetical protein
MQSPEQTPQQRRPYGFQPGRSGNPAGRLSNAQKQALLAAKAAELAEEFGGINNLTTVERTMVEQAATLLCRRPRRADDLVRCANAVQRLLAGIKRRHKPAGRGSLSSMLKADLQHG